MNVRFQPATAADVPALAELLGLLFTAEADFAPDVDKQVRGLRMILDDPTRGVIFVARQEGRVVGMVSLLYSVSTAQGGPVCWLEDMVFRPECRSAGVGSQLLEYAIAQAQTRGLSRITLLTDCDNAGAIRFYQRHGFQPSAMTPLRLYLT